MISPPQFVTGLQCLICGTKYAHGNMFTCTKCGIEGILDVQYDYDRAGACLKQELQNRPQDHWRYRELIPVSPDLPLPHLHVGWTPVYDAMRLARTMGARKVFVKDDGRN